MRARRSPYHCSGERMRNSPDAHDVVLHPVASLNPGRRENQRTFLVEVTGIRHVGGGLGVSDIRLVGLGEHGEAVRAARIHDGNQHAQVRGVRASVIRGVVKEGVAAFQLGVKALHGLRHEIGAREDVDGYRLRRGQQLVPAAQDAAGTVVAARDDAGARCPHERMLHRPGDGIETPGQYRECDRVHSARCSRGALALSEVLDARHVVASCIAGGAHLFRRARARCDSWEARCRARRRAPPRDDGPSP